MIPLVDFETRSRAELTDVGIWNYAAHPSTEVICVVLRDPDGEIIELTGDEARAMGEGPGWEEVCAHNAINFDRHIWRMLGWREPKRWIDTAEIARVAGYEKASLEYLASHLLGHEKDSEGNALTLKQSTPALYYGELLAAELEQAKAEWRLAHPKGSGGGRLPTARLKAEVGARLDARGAPSAPVSAEDMARIMSYCRLDVELLAGILDGFLVDWIGSDLPGLEEADRALNDRGIHFDAELARVLLAASGALADQALQEAGEALVAAGQVVEASGLATVDVSPQRLKVRLAAMGVAVENCEADTLEAALQRPGLPPAAAALIRARQASSSIAAGKLRAGLLRVSPDGRLRANRTYMGAHTGRWAGKGMQLDNMAAGA